MNWRIITILLVTLSVFAGYQYLKPDSPNVTNGGALVAVSVPSLSGSALDGEKAFNTNCLSCHGEDAAGQDGVAPPLIHKIYEPSHHGDMAFVLAVKQGVRQHHWPFGNMPPVPGVSDEQTSSIIAYIRTLQRANGIQ